jgi:hypothetical protein
MLKKACFGRKTARFGGFSAANDTSVVNIQTPEIPDI